MDGARAGGYIAYNARNLRCNMAKKKQAEAEEATATGTPPGEEISKAEAVRRAVAKGYDKPAKGVKYILDEFGIEITPQTFSATKSQQRTREEKKAGPEGVTAQPMSTSSHGRTNGTSGSAELARAVKQLVQRYGAAEVKGMADVFAE